MKRPIEKFIFRAYSDNSNGSNSSISIAPQVSADMYSKDWHGLHYDDSYGSLPDQLHHVIMGYETTANPFTFWTGSLICAFLHALKKQKVGETRVQIICIPASKALNGNGDPVAFKWLPSVMERLRMRPIHARWTGLPLDFADVWITTDTVMIADDSMKVSLAALIANGLYEFLPELGLISRRAKTGLATPLADLRKIWYRGDDADLNPSQITLAAHLSTAFKQVRAESNKYDVPIHLFAWFLALKAQDPYGVRFEKWLDSNSSGRATKCLDGLATDTEATLESNQWARLYVRLQGKRISPVRVPLIGWNPAIRLVTVEAVEHAENRYKRFKKRKSEGAVETEDSCEQRKRVRLCIGG